MQDIRYALRSIGQNRTFAIVAVLCLSLGIGLNTTIFSVVDGILLKPFPYRDSDRIVVVRAANEPRGITRSSLSYLDYQDLQKGSHAFEALAAVQYRSIAISDSGGEPERYSGAAVSWNLFRLLGVAPVVGQDFTPEMDQPDAAGVVLISDIVWRDRYHSAPDVAGRRVLVNGKPAVIIGVMPPHFEFPQNQRMWVPLAPTEARNGRDYRDLFVVARLGPGATLASAGAELATRTGALAQQYPDTNDGWTARVATLRAEFIPPDVSLVIWIMMASVTLVLFIACSNVANLQLARATSRRREFSVRAALGAGRARIIRQLLTESVVLAVLSVPLAVLFAEIGTRLIEAGMPPDGVPYYITWTVDWRSMLYAAAVAVATAVLFGTLPALQTSRGDLVDTLKEGGRGGSLRRSKLRSGLVVAQVSLALVSLVGALLFVQTFTNLNAYDVGFDTKPLMAMRFYMAGDVYEATDAKLRRVDDVVHRVEALPAVESAFASNLIPVSGGGGGGQVVVDGRPSDKGREPFIGFVGVSPHFHRTLGVSMSEGRDFTDAEGWSSQPVAVVNRTMADRFWPDRGAVGGRFRLTGPNESWFTVVGVAPDIKQDDIDPDDQPVPTAYVPYAFQQTFSTGLTVRVTGDPASVTSAIREAIRSADPTIPVTQPRTMEEVRRDGFWQYGLFGWIFGVTGVIGLLLASVGVYGVLSYAVSQRSTEIGVRMALGAARRDVLRLIVGHGLVLAGIGVGVGLVLGPLGTWFGRSLFFNVSPFDPVTFTGVAAFLMGVAFLASYMPARRATRVDPVRALKGD